MSLLPMLKRPPMAGESYEERFGSLGRKKQKAENFFAFLWKIYFQR
jgi:hypothetical protein